MRPIWLNRKKEKRRNDIFWLLVVLNIFVYIFSKEFLPFSVIASIIVGTIAFKRTKKEFSKRSDGLVIEDKEGLWLESIFSQHGIKLKRSIKMRYGDIDIFLPDLGIVIDVKGYRSPKGAASIQNLKSLDRQLQHSGAHTAILWLPYAVPRNIEKYNEKVYIISGRKKIISFFGIKTPPSAQQQPAHSQSL